MCCPNGVSVGIPRLDCSRIRMGLRADAIAFKILGEEYIMISSIKAEQSSYKTPDIIIHDFAAFCYYNRMQRLNKLSLEERVNRISLYFLILQYIYINFCRTFDTCSGLPFLFGYALFLIYVNSVKITFICTLA